MSGTDLESKRLEILKDAVPGLKKVMILHDPSMGPNGIAEVETAVRALALQSVLIEADSAKFAESSTNIDPSFGLIIRHR